MQLKQLIWLLGKATINIKIKVTDNPEIIKAQLNCENNCILLQDYLAQQQYQINAAAITSGQTLTTVLTTIQTLLEQDYSASILVTKWAQKGQHWTIQRLLDDISQTLKISVNILDQRQQIVFASEPQRLPETLLHHWQLQRPITTQRLTLSQNQAQQQLFLTGPFRRQDLFLLAFDQKKRTQLGLYCGILQRLEPLFATAFHQQDHDVAAQATADSLFSDTLADLIHSQTIHPQVLAQWQLKPGSNYYILTSSFKVHLSPVIIHDFLKTLTPILGQVVYCIENTHLVVLCETDQSLNTLQRQLSQLDPLTANYDFLMTFSMPFQYLEQVSVAYQQCITTQAYARTAELPDRILFFQDVSLLSLIDRVRKETDLEHYIHPDLHFLAKYDQRHQTEYLETLHFYLYFECNTARTAKALHIHPNTLLYRIQKIKQLLDYPLDFGKQNLDYRMGYLILYSQNKVRRPEARYFNKSTKP